MTYKLLIVDDELPNIRLLERLFRQDYFCLTASSGEEAINLLDQHEVAVIITDQRMPQMTGIELLKKSADRRPHMVRILLTGYTDLEALVEAVNCGLVYMYISKPWNNEDLRLRVGRAVEHYENNKRQHSLASTNERLSARLKEMKLGFVRAMAGLLKLRDEYLYAHGARVSRYAGLLGERLGLNEDLILDLMVAAYLHDLDKKAEQSAQVVSCVAELKDAADIIRYHHENFDGSGRPLGLIGDQIPLTARVARVAKEFDLLTKPRNPDSALTLTDAMEQLRFGTGREFDPQVVLTLSELAGELGNFNDVPSRPELITYAIN
ncbi:MAG TPA: HD domain-containing phosphohydrolase [Pyrinomonadaceae bacterium]|nr:HD domain-containing phosphohydrolase [Pyrinomonadaceae bacterium]